MQTPPPPPPPSAVHAQAPAQKQSNSSENYGRKAQTASRMEKSNHIPYQSLATGRILSRPAKWPKTPRKKHTNRHHSRKQAKQRHKRNGR